MAGHAKIENEVTERAIAIARGCLQYSGGYRLDEEKLEAFHHGVETVVRALEAARSRPCDMQAAMLERAGAIIAEDKDALLWTMGDASHQRSARERAAIAEAEGRGEGE